MLSIIIPTYNREELITYTLDSLDTLLHPGVELEVLVIDDNSTDNTVAFIQKQYPHVRVLKNTTNGAASARNVGLAAATGKYIVYLDSDDLAGPGWFAAKLDYLESHSDCDACYGNYDFFSSDDVFSEDKIIFRHKYPMYTDGTRYAKEHLINYLGGNFLPSNGIVWRKEFLLRRHGHDETMAVNQDVELFVRCIFNGLRIIGVPDNTRTYIRNHSLDNRVGDPQNKVGKYRQILKLRKKIFGDLKVYAFEDDDCSLALSTYCFNYWKMLRHTEPEIAFEFLDFAKKVYWPLPPIGGVGFKLMSLLLGQVKATELKYTLLKRD